MTDIQHGHHITTETIYDGKVTSTKRELEQSIFTDKQNLLKEIIDGLALVNSGESNKLTIEVCLDNKGRYRLIKKWSVDSALTL